MSEMKILKKSELRFELEQVTPMIHFQGTENGAGIRASDLKPRFDVFLSGFAKDELKDYVLPANNENKGNSKKAFDYKVRINNITPSKIDAELKGKTKEIKKNEEIVKKIIIGYGACYAELGLSSETVFYESIEVTFIIADRGKNKKLRETIEKYFPIFISVNSFGLRNNKGYGYFKIKGKKHGDIVEDIKEYKKIVNEQKSESIGVYKIGIEVNKNYKAEKTKDTLNEIKIFHQILKSGYNSKKEANYEKRHGSNSYNNEKLYIPSLMLKEYKEFSKDKNKENMTFEKKAFKLFLKKEGYDISNLTRKGDVKPEEEFKDIDGEVYYVRGLLGLAPFYSFLGVTSKKDTFDRFVIKIKGNKITRFASPITYIPFPAQGYFLMLIDYERINRFRKQAGEVKFVIKNNIKNKDKNKHLQTDTSSKKENKHFQAIIPNEEEYSISLIFKEDGVLKKFLDKYNNNIKCIPKCNGFKYEGEL